MPEKKEAKKKVKVVYFNCKYCNKGLKTAGARTNHEKNCPLTNQEPKIETQEVAKKITPELQEKMEEATSPLAVVENRIRQAEEGGVPISQEDQQVIKEVLKFVQAQKKDQEEIDSNLQQAEKIKSKSKIVQATQDFENLKPGDKIGLQEAMAFSTILNAQTQQQSAQQTQQMNQLYIQERMRKMDQPKETSNKFQEQLLLTLIKDMNQAKAENDIEKFSKSYEAVKKMTELIGEKDTGTAAILGKVAEQIIPPLMDLGKEAMKQKQGHPEFLKAPAPAVPTANPGPESQSDNISLPEEGVVSSPPSHNPGEPAVAPPQENPEPSDEELMNNPELRDEYRPVQLDNTSINQYLNIDKFEKFAPSSTAPTT